MREGHTYVTSLQTPWRAAPTGRRGGTRDGRILAQERQWVPLQNKRTLIALVAVLSLLGGCEVDKGVAVGGGGLIAAGSGPKKTVQAPARRVDLVWPTPNRAFAEGREIDAYIQPTASGQVTSGLYGSVRSGGRQFHEGLDLRPTERDRKGEAIDPVSAALAGVVRHVNLRAGASSYGRYVVLEHPDESPPVYTLYAHLAAVAPGIGPGVTVKAGQVLATMGRSAGGYTIPKDRAHLHFEIGVRVTDSFAAWYRRKGFGSPNEQGLYNGMNLLGLDPLDVFTRHQKGQLDTLDAVFRATPMAVRFRVAEPATPDFLRRYPSLLAKRAESDTAISGGWEIECSATGVPVRWRKVPVSELAGWKRGETRVLARDDALLAANRGRSLVAMRKGVAVPGDDLKVLVEQLFGTGI